MTRPAQRRELAEKAVATKGVSIALACRAFGVSETCFRYSRLCCTNPVWDSSHESSVVAGIHEQTYTPDLQ
ncbi:hypothetical protein SAMN05421774_1321, partial [Gemmobacter megaterium]